MKKAAARYHISDKQHRKVKQQNGCIGDGGIFAGKHLHLFLCLGELICAVLHFRLSGCTNIILNGLIQAPEAVQHKGGQAAGFGAEAQSGVSGAP